MSLIPSSRTGSLRLGLTTTLLVVIFMVAGCGGNSSPKSSPTGTSATGEAVKVSLSPASSDIDSFTWNLPSGEPVTSDPAGSNTVSATTVIPNVCEPLLRYNPDNSVSPGLATKWSNPSPTRWVYTIRQGVRFSDGKAMTVDDVVYSVRRNLEPKIGSFGTAYQDVKSVEKTGPWQATVTMKQPSVLFNLFAATGASGVSEKAFVEKAGSKYGTPSTGVMCTGPFKFESWKPGASMTIARNDDYWDAAHKAKAESVKFSFITETNTYVNALRSGEVDGSFDLSPGNAAALKTASTGAPHNGPSFSWSALVPRRPQGLMGNVKIRQALNLAIPREGIASKLYGGTATPLYWMAPTVALQSPAVPAPAAAIYKAAYGRTPRTNVTAAKKLVKEAGSPKTPINIGIFPGDDIGRQTSTVIQQAAEQIGLNVQIRPSPGPQIEQGFIDPKVLPDIDLLWDKDAFRAPSALTNAPYFVGPVASSNLIKYQDAGVDAALKKALGATDPTDAAGSLSSVLGTMARDAVTIPLVATQSVVFVNKRLGGVPLSHPYNQNGAWAAPVRTP